MRSGRERRTPVGEVASMSRAVERRRTIRCRSRDPPGCHLGARGDRAAAAGLPQSSGSSRDRPGCHPCAAARGCSVRCGRREQQRTLACGCPPITVGTPRWIPAIHRRGRHEGGPSSLLRATGGLESPGCDRLRSGNPLDLVLEGQGHLIAATGGPGRWMSDGLHDAGGGTPPGCSSLFTAKGWVFSGA